MIEVPFHGISFMLGVAFSWCVIGALGWLKR